MTTNNLASCFQGWGLGYVFDIFFRDETEECFRLLIGRHASTVAVVATRHVGGNQKDGVSVNSHQVSSETIVLVRLRVGF